MENEAGSMENEDPAVQRLYDALLPQDGRWCATHGALRLSSHFQPIYSLPHRRPVGYEALVRVQGAGAAELPPLTFFEGLSSFDEQLHADRLCRLLHVHNYVQQGQTDGWLFLNIHPSVFVHGALRAPLLEQAVDVVGRLGLPPQRIVFEVTEAVLANEDDFEAAVANARETGCLLALDDFGAGHSNFDRVWRVRPEIVKLDRSLLSRAMGSSQIARVMTQMVSLLHECGALVLLEGVETQDEALLALDADIDLVQGYAFGRPQPDLLAPHQYSTEIERAWTLLDERHAEGRGAYARRLAPFQAALKKALPALRQGQSLRAACAALLALPEVQLCYLLDEQGRALGPAVAPAQQRLDADQRFAPIEQAGDARWSRRAYFRRAVTELGQVQMTRPYLSLNGARMCVTVSLAFWCQAKLQVLCADLDWQG
jgi:EAL domain-containing protein (putative c-di-GMP-specific phosphodiesterase class I)